MIPTHKARSYRFSGFEFDPQSGELLKLGSKIKLQGQPLDILAMLLERGGEVVTREELQRRLWPADTFVDFEHSLNAAVKRLREALGESADTPQFIETLPRRGYRFIGPIEGKPVAPALEGARRRSGWHWTAYSAIALVVLAGVALGMNLRGWRDLVLHGSAVPPIRSIAVKPLENLSGDPEQEYFADGMTDSLIAALAQISALRVISRTSMMRYKGTKKSLPEIARELNVDAVVEGTVLRSGSRMRIIAELVYAPTDAHLWAKSYERDLGDVLKMQSELAQAIAAEIRIKLTPQERTRLASARPVNPEAHEAYLKGRYFLNKFTPDGLKRSVDYFEQAIKKDPSYALAHAGLADSYIFGGSGLPPKEAMPKAKASAAKALGIDDTLAEAHTSLGFIKLFYDWDWLGAERDLSLAIELNPGYAAARELYAIYLATIGRVNQATAESKRALELDPLSLFANDVFAQILYNARQYDQAIAQCKKTLELDPNLAAAHAGLGLAYRQKQMFEQSVAETQKSLTLAGEKELAEVFGRAYSVSGYRSALRKLLDEAKKRGNLPPYATYGVAADYAFLGDKDEALAWLEKAYENRSPGPVFLKVDPRLDSLRSDPRFQALLRRMNFPPR
jgi:TolB-like protein/DNA-binding winged helix-turn-helix (wHTH) protein/Tfp pilus assembly protein PilF